MTSLTSATPAAPTVGAVLAIIHEAWTKHVTAFLAPATDLQADLWSRWGAARVLGDEFDDGFRLECAFATALGDILPPGDVARLGATREEVERTREALTAAGRRRESAELTAVLARRFVEVVARWCVELELATTHLRPADLPVAARRLLVRLRVAHAFGR